MSELYPIKFKPIYKEKVWGGDRLRTQLNKTDAPSLAGESWELSGVEGSVSIVENGFLAGNELSELIEIYMGDIVGERVFDTFGTEFPLLFKFIDANDILSVQVHPDDELASKKHSSNGKSEIWYVVEGEPDAFIYTGFAKSLTQEKFRHHIENNTVKEVLNRESVATGDAFYIPAGRIHATGRGVLFAEIQQSSDITYRVYDWDRKDQNGKLRELHVEDALQALDFTLENRYRTLYTDNHNTRNEIQQTPYFVLNKLNLNKTFEAEYNTVDSFVVYMCIHGGAVIEYGSNLTVRINKGETVLIPAVLESIKVIPDAKVELLEIFLPADQ